jgi:hypothetical protein
MNLVPSTGRAEILINDHVSFMRCLGLQAWRPRAVEVLFDRVDEALKIRTGSMRRVSG